MFSKKGSEKKIRKPSRQAQLEAQVDQLEERLNRVQSTMEYGMECIGDVRDELMRNAFLIKKDDGQIFAWTEDLAKRHDMRLIPALQAIRIIDGKARIGKVNRCPSCFRVQKGKSVDEIETEYLKIESGMYDEE